MDIIKCSNCHKPLYPVELSNNIRKTWCDCEKVGIPTGWFTGRVEEPRYEQRYGRGRR